MPADPSPTFLALQAALAGRYALERELGRGGVAALEQVRLDLLRLGTGGGAEGELTSNLDAARRVSERIEALLEAQGALEFPTPVSGV